MRSFSVRFLAVEYADLQKAPFFGECDKIARAQGCALVELNVSRRPSGCSAAAVIAAPGDVGIDACASVHKALQARLEELLGAASLQMQVSSPGIGRRLKNAAEFACFEGKNVRLWLFPQGERVEGRIVSSSSSAVVLEGKEGQKEYPYSEISKARLSD